MNWALAQALARNSLAAAGVTLSRTGRQDISLSAFKAAVYRGYEDAAHLRLLDEHCET